MHGIVDRLQKNQLVLRQELKHLPVQTVAQQEKKRSMPQAIYIKKQKIRKLRPAQKMGIQEMSIAVIVGQNWNLEQ